MNKLLDLRWNLVWYLPLMAAMLIFLMSNVGFALRAGAAFFNEFSWAVVISPANWLFWSAIATLVIAPAGGGLLIANIGSHRLSSHEMMAAAARMTVMILIACVVAGVLAWGAFPFFAGSDGYIHIRMIPFLPWPHTSFF